MDLKVLLQTVTVNVTTGLLILIMAGGQPKLDGYAALMGVDIKDEQFIKDWKHMSGATQIENGDNGDKIILYTASVLYNRMKSPKWKGDTIEEVVLAKEGKYWQYAPVTRNNFKTIKTTKRVRYLCKFVMIFGSVVPETVVYQGQKENGSGVYESCPVPGQPNEIFCYE